MRARGIPYSFIIRWTLSYLTRLVPCESYFLDLRSISGTSALVNSATLVGLIRDRCFDSERVVVGRSDHKITVAPTDTSVQFQLLPEPRLFCRRLDASYGFDTGSVSSINEISRGEKL